MDKKIIINFCPTGMVPTKDLSPYVPVSPSEIIEETCMAYEKGITIAHLHARNPDETPSWNPDIYGIIFDGIRQYCPDLVLCGSSSGRNFPEIEKRAALLKLKPDMCSLTLSSLNFRDQASVNHPETILGLIEKMKKYGVHPELECFDLGMINYGLYLRSKKILTDPLYWNLLFGNITGFQADPLHIGTAMQMIPDSDFVSFAGLGKYQLKVHGMAISMGQGVRVGLEDNIWWDKNKTELATNKTLLDRIHQLLDIHQYEYMPAREFGKMGFYNKLRCVTPLAS